MSLSSLFSFCVELKFVIILNIPLSLIFHVSGFRAEVLYLGQENPFPIVVLNMQTETEAAIAVPYKNQLPTKPIVIPTARNDFCLLQIIPSLISPRLRDQGGGPAFWTGDPLPPSQPTTTNSSKIFPCRVGQFTQLSDKRGKSQSGILAGSIKNGFMN